MAENVFFDINTYALLIMLMLYLIMRRNSDLHEEQSRVFCWILAIAAVLLFTDYLSTRGAVFMPLSVVKVTMFSTYALCSLIAVPTFVWFSLQMDFTKKIYRRLKSLILVMCVVDMVLLGATIYTGWYFYFDADAVYHRGELFYLHVAIPTFVLFGIEAMLIINRWHIRNDNFVVLLLFPVPVILTIILSIVFPDSSLIPAGIAFSMLYIFINVQSRDLGHDILTRIYNRRKLEQHIHQQMKIMLPGMMFAVIMVDLEHFQQINMEYGRRMGDEALRDMALLLKRSVRHRDFIARYGSHEFCVVLDDIRGSEEISSVTHEIQKQVDNFNYRHDPDKPYMLYVHLDYDIYASEMQLNFSDFMRRIERHLYTAQEYRRVEARIHNNEMN